MPWSARSQCSWPGCATVAPRGASRCAEHQTEQHRTRAANRREDPERGVYGLAVHKRFRQAVLDRDELCVLCLAAGVPRVARVADHWPLSRRELQAKGLDPNDPAHGRALCWPCHSRETVRNQAPGSVKR